MYVFKLDKLQQEGAPQKTLPKIGDYQSFVVIADSPTGSRAVVEWYLKSQGQAASQQVPVWLSDTFSSTENIGRSSTDDKPSVVVASMWRAS